MKLKLKLLKPYSMFAPGSLVEFDKPIADLLILRKIAAPVEEEKKKPRIIKNAQQQTVE